MRNIILTLISFTILGVIACKKPHIEIEPPPPPPPLSGIKVITDFVLEAANNAGLTINDTAKIVFNDTIVLNVPYGFDLSHLKPTVTYRGVSLNPDSGAVQDFSNPVNYV